jgi:GT2 family glycosyltransferase
LIKDLQDGFHVAAPKFTYPNGKFQPSTRKFPELKHLLVVRNSVFRPLFSGSQIERDYFGFYLEKQKEPVRLTDRFPVGGFFVIKRNVFEELKGFDEKFFIYFEDTDFFKRLLEKGYSILYDPRAVIIHYHGFSTKKASLCSKYHKIKSYYLYLRKHCKNMLMLFILGVFMVFYVPFAAFLEFCNFLIKEKSWESAS